MIRRISACTALLLSLTACGIGSRPAEELYILHAQKPAVSKGAVATTISIANPEAAPGLDSPRIAVTDAPNHLTYYTGAAWAQSLPVLIQQFLIDSFQQSGAFANVSNDQDELIPNVTLLTDIRKYEVDTTVPGPMVRIRIVATLVSASHKSIATFTVEKTAVADANHMPNIVAAFDKATNEAAKDILRGVIKSKYGKK